MLKELNGWNLMTKLAELAEPVGNLVNDDEFWEAFTECTKNGAGLRMERGLRFFLQTYGSLLPILMSEEHKRDTFAIIAAATGRSVNECANMNGMQMLKEFGAVFVGDLQSFFTSHVLSALRE